MNIKLLGQLKVIQSNPDSNHNYFAWPSVARLKNGRIAVGSSGFRLRHICPFGKAVLSFSDDEGETYSSPMPVIDTPLDDRDVGITPFGKSSVLISSFNNTVDFQKKYNSTKPYDMAYLDTVSPGQVDKYYASQFRISDDNGITFGEIFHSPVTSHHGPVELANGRILWVGRTFQSPEFPGPDEIQAYYVNPDGSMEYAGKIENISDENGALLSCEPDVLELPDGTILCHIRVQRSGENSVFTIYQSESHDNGKTWTAPYPLLLQNGGAPAHLLLHSSGTIICAYGYRAQPYGIRLMFSHDSGKTWETDNVLYSDGTSGDIGYPATVELEDKSLLTVFYAHYPSKDDPAVILQQKWSFE